MVVLLPPTSPPLCPPPSRAKTETFGEREFAKADGVQHVHVMTNVGVTVVYKSQISEPKAPANVDRTPPTPATCYADCLGSVSKYEDKQTRLVVRTQPPRDGETSV